jgi:hypothetical protein
MNRQRPDLHWCACSGPLRAGKRSGRFTCFRYNKGKEVTSMCKTCRSHHPELYTDKPVAKPGKKEKAAPKKK